jgi:endonuclease/exonuclease/phosphatase family metal-dependent hydrolase
MDARDPSPPGPGADVNADLLRARASYDSVPNNVESAALGPVGPSCVGGLRRSRQVGLGFLALCVAACSPARTVLDDDRSTDTGVTDRVSDPPVAVETDIASEPTPFSILSLNLHCFKLEGTPFSDNAARFASIAATVAATDIGAVALQEVCIRDGEDAIVLLEGAIEAATGVNWSRAYVDTHLAWVGTPDEAQEGVGLLVRGELREVSVAGYAVQGALERRMIAGTFDTADGAVRLVSVHLEYDDPAARAAQARATAMEALVRAPSDWRVVVAGDFNGRIVDPSVMNFQSAGFSRLSAASDPSNREIDHLFAPTAAGFDVESSRLAFTGDEEAPVSDHPGVIVRLRAGAPGAATVSRFVANAQVSSGYLALRGERDPLSWSLGWPAVQTAESRWEAVFLGWPSGDVPYKWLRDDATWESGDNHVLRAGASFEVSPQF